MVGNSSWKYNWEGRKFKAGKMPVVVEKQLTEVDGRSLAHRHALLLVRSREDNHPYLQKIRYELDPNDFDMIDNIEEMKRLGGNHVRFEIDLINELYQIGHGPKHICSSYCIHPVRLPYPGGKIWFKIMERVPGDDMNDIEQRSTEECGCIRKQLAKILQEMADKDRILLE